METVVVSTEVLCAQKNYYSAVNGPYNIDLWKEVKRRWLVFGVLAAILLAVISPQTGAPGGPLHTEYLRLVPGSVIYYNAGARLRAAPARLAGAAALHALVAAPALAACTLTVFRASLHAAVVSGALLSSLGGGCAWLSLALSPHGGAAAVAGSCWLAALLATPLGVLLLCGRTTIPPLGDVLSEGALSGAPFLLGAALRRPTARRRTASRAAALALLYAECCARLADAAGALHVGDLLATLLVEVIWVCVNAGACGAYARWWGPRGARLIAACAVPSAPHGWGAASACGAPALARLPGVFATPAQALLLAAMYCPDDEDDDTDWADAPPEKGHNWLFPSVK